MMTLLWLLLLTSLPCVWAQGASRAALEAAGIKRICALTEAELSARQKLPTPAVTARAGVASPTRSPWIVANGWRFMRSPGAKFVYDVPAGKAALAAAE